MQRRDRSSDFRATYFRAFSPVGNGICGFVPGHSGGAVLEFHQVPG